MASLDKQIEQLAGNDDRSRRLMSIPGIGPMEASALVAAIGDINAFKNGRELVAWLGLVPRRSSTGGRALDAEQVLRALLSAASAEREVKSLAYRLSHVDPVILNELGYSAFRPVEHSCSICCQSCTSVPA